MFAFDAVIDRRSSSSSKWVEYGERDVLPFWVADMDFATPGFLLAAIQDRLKHPILGYTEVPQRLESAVIEWAQRRFNWKLDPDWIVWISAVVPGMNVALRSIGNAGDTTLHFIPIYPPFLDMPANNDRLALTTELRIDSGSWVMDLDDVKKKCLLASSLLFCNPQNPTGRVYSREELLGLAEICLATETVLISDEIHWGLILDEDKEHIPIASLSSDIAANTITILSHTKSYNLAGMQSAIAIIPNEVLRKNYEDAIRGSMTSGSPLAYAAAISAYEDDSAWLSELSSYLRSNRDLLEERANDLNRISMTHVEGTHLAWLDARSIPVQNPKRYLEAFGLGLSDGEEFGMPGFVRFNFAAPRTLLEQGIDRLQNAVSLF